MRRSIAAAIIGLGLLGGCAAPGSLEEGEVYDPLEVPNRMIFAVNETLDIFILQPTAYVYRTVVPDPVRNMVAGFLGWVSTPVILANDAFQGDWTGAGITAQRFVANAPFFGTVENVPTLKTQNEDFGQTLGHYGAGDGFYLMLPVLGPSNTRDGIGKVVDYFLDPVRYIGNDDVNSDFQMGRRVAGAVDFRARNFDAINDLRESSVDYYARVRSIYKQRRDALIRDGEPGSYGASSPKSDGKEFDGYPGTSTEQTSSRVSTD
jgi:phospholipid-binding lipoprotein MlaA